MEKQTSTLYEQKCIKREDVRADILDAIKGRKGQIRSGLDFQRIGGTFR
jgi:hypothetical protein